MAIKVLEKSRIQSTRDVERITREIQILNNVEGYFESGKLTAVMVTRSQYFSEKEPIKEAPSAVQIQT